MIWENLQPFLEEFLSELADTDTEELMKADLKYWHRWLVEKKKFQYLDLP